MYTGRGIAHRSGKPVGAEKAVPDAEVLHRFDEDGLEAKDAARHGEDAGVRDKQRASLVVRGHLHVEPYLFRISKERREKKPGGGVVSAESEFHRNMRPIQPSNHPFVHA